MPEGHTIHRLAQQLRASLSGPVEVSSPQGRFTEASQLDGLALSGAHAIGKHLFLDFDELRLHVHLGLFGRFRKRRQDDGPRASARLRLRTADVTWELTGPTACHLVDPDAYRALRRRLGADPLAEAPRPLETWRRVHASKRPIGALLLDQSIFAGIGNVYRAELLFLVGLDPATPGRLVPKATFDRLWRIARSLLAAGARSGRIVTVPLRERREAPRSRREQLYVYGRTRCRRCNGPVARSTMAARTLHHCPACQPPRDPAPDAGGTRVGA